MDKPDYLLRMRPAKDWPYPEMVSLRRLLKAFLRRYGFEMLSVEEIEREDKRACKPGGNGENRADI